MEPLPGWFSSCLLEIVNTPCVKRCGDAKPSMVLHKFGWVHIFSLGLLFCVNASVMQAADHIDYYGLLFRKSYDQQLAMEPDTATNFEFYAYAISDSPEGAPESYSGSLVNPASALSPMAVDLVDNDIGYYRLGYGQTFATELAMTTAFGSGEYVFNVESEALDPDQQTGSISVGASFYAESIPYFTNFASFNAVLADQPFTLQWNSLIEASGADQSEIYLRVIDIESSDVLLNEVWGGLNYTFGPGVFSEGKQYAATLTFSTHMLPTGDLGFEGTVQEARIIYNLSTEAEFTVVPEPAVSCLIGFAVSGIAMSRRRAKATSH